MFKKIKHTQKKNTHTNLRSAVAIQDLDVSLLKQVNAEVIIDAAPKHIKTHKSVFWNMLVHISEKQA